MHDPVAVAALIVAVLAIGFGLWAARRWGTRRARLNVSIETTPLLPDDGSGLLKLTFRDIDVEDPHLVSVAVTNAGPRDVASSMFDQGRPISFRFDQTFYGLTTVQVPPGGNVIAPAVGTSGANAAVGIAPALLKRGSTWSFSAVTKGPVEVTVDAPLIDTDVSLVDPNAPTREVRVLSAIALSLVGVALQVPFRELQIGTRRRA